MLKKLRLLMTGGGESEDQAKKRIKLKQQELAEQLKRNHAYQKSILNDSTSEFGAH